ncbi:hypothetical protein D0Z00_001251 [Geotrichum galactomycetum]|uniref:Uncharacterized protein n=1 Tax=Geotrichum galactomycetum TaxID=27317 RepID=A0ACB6V7Q0_9ASCO|nr:hypothetical protein D0Z00_001251 [Geotrichum candidum]
MSSRNLFKPITVGKIVPQHRLVMAPLTRFRSPNHVPTDLVAQYYKQRASAPGTLIISEATFITEAAGGYENVPGIYNPAQIAAWGKVAASIHEQNSFFFIQLWSLGRAADKNYLDRLGHKYVAPSAIPNPGVNVKYVQKKQEVEDWNKQHPEDLKPVPEEPVNPVPHALTEEEILAYIDAFVQAAKNAVAAGADGVEIHNANGYLLEQFLSESSNQRTDKWGGSVENRARFTLAVVDAVVAAIGAERTGIRLSPWRSYAQADESSSPLEQWSYVFNELERRGREGKRLAYIHLVEPRADLGSNPHAIYNKSGDNAAFVKLWSGSLIRAGGYKLESALAATDADARLLIGVGRYFISTPDLVARWRLGREPNPYNRSTFYSPGAKGYTDYPFAEELQVAA